MKRTVLFLFFTHIVLLLSAQNIKIMLVTGGHSFDTIQFFEMFDTLEGIEYDHFQQPMANRKLVKDLAEDYDVLVFYDMWKDISFNEKAAYLKLTEMGKPFLFLHHSIASYQNWNKFEEIMGGKYIVKQPGVDEDLLSAFEHDVWVYGKVEKYTPATKGLREVRFFDEVYDNVRISDKVIPLIKTKHPKSMDVIAWEHSYNASKIIYLQPGHDKRTYVEGDYRKLVAQSIRFLALAK